jgi:RHS repeat-associated protein
MHHQGTNYLYTADGNGNVTEVTDDQGTVVASYIYSPFGKLVSSSGTFASENPWLFSSQWYERRWKHYRYVYRIYLPDIGWLSRDPIGQGVRDESSNRPTPWIPRGATIPRLQANLYHFVYNNPIGSVDKLGLDMYDECKEDFKKGHPYPCIPWGSLRCKALSRTLIRAKIVPNPSWVLSGGIMCTCTYNEVLCWVWPWKCCENWKWIDRYQREKDEHIKTYNDPEVANAATDDYCLQSCKDFEKSTSCGQISAVGGAIPQ